MRSLLLFVMIAVMAPVAQAGDFVPRAPKAQAEPAKPVMAATKRPSKVVRRSAKAKPVAKKKKKKVAHEIEKRPLP